MTRDDLIVLSAAEIDRLPADELAVVERHYGTTDRDTLLQLFSEEAEEMWGEPGEAPVEPKDWSTAHLDLLLQVHRLEEKDRIFDEQRQITMALVDGLDPARRALLCWRFRVTDRRRISAMLVTATVRAMEEGLVREPSFKEAAAVVIDFEIEVQIDEIDELYRNTAPAPERRDE
jgi:hypothetical protein